MNQVPHSVKYLLLQTKLFNEDVTVNSIKEDQELRDEFPLVRKKMVRLKKSHKGKPSSVRKSGEDLKNEENQTGSDEFMVGGVQDLDEHTVETAKALLDISADIHTMPEQQSSDDAEGNIFNKVNMTIAYGCFERMLSGMQNYHKRSKICPEELHVANFSGRTDAEKKMVCGTHLNLLQPVKKRFWCRICKRNFQNLRELQLHIRFCTSKKTEDFADSRPVDKYNPVVNQKMKRPNRYSENKHSKRAKILKLNCCNVPSTGTIKEHSKVSGEKDSRNVKFCNLCNQHFDLSSCFESLSNNQVLLWHPAKNGIYHLVCKRCSFTTVSLKDFKQHSENHHPDMSSKISASEESLHKQETKEKNKSICLDLGIERLHKGKNFKCDGAQFENLFNMVKTNHSNTDQDCKIVGVSSSVQTDYDFSTNHYRISKEVSDCGMSLVEKVEGVIMDSCNLKCLLCQKLFIDRSKLMLHCAKHLRVYYFQCKICGHAHLHQNDLRRHIKRHDVAEADIDRQILEINPDDCDETGILRSGKNSGNSPEM